MTVVDPALLAFCAIDELELDPPKEKEVLVRYLYTGYCHNSSWKTLTTWRKRW